MVARATWLPPQQPHIVGAHRCIIHTPASFLSRADGNDFNLSQLTGVQASVRGLQNLSGEGGFSCILETSGPGLWLCAAALCSGATTPGQLPPTTPSSRSLGASGRAGLAGAAFTRVPIPSH